ncbi:hypothetical protein TNIN_336301 [Trichonephila inaurata madagascariensis]|uniref:Uncharacterized protein n=1 Tax=Trichonephila inaurata madagascariensis TaxID=2747483 RepID=A0A8X6YJD3_9ARAC|nr:hypothetical protein TNIN_336301 [Trichonephila inaurata madagascariensis]
MYPRILHPGTDRRPEQEPSLTKRCVGTVASCLMLSAAIFPSLFWRPPCRASVSDSNALSSTSSRKTRGEKEKEKHFAAGVHFRSFDLWKRQAIMLSRDAGYVFVCNAKRNSLCLLTQTNA